MPHMDTIPLVDDLNGISRVDINSQTDILQMGFRYWFDLRNGYACLIYMVPVFRMDMMSHMNISECFNIPDGGCVITEVCPEVAIYPRPNLDSR